MVVGNRSRLGSRRIVAIAALMCDCSTCSFTVTKNTIKVVRHNRRFTLISLWAALFPRGVANVLKQRQSRTESWGKDRGEIAQLPELRIIDEDDHHAVITVRIKKAWLAANLPSSRHSPTSRRHRPSYLSASGFIVTAGSCAFCALAALDLAVHPGVDLLATRDLAPTALRMKSRASLCLNNASTRQCPLRNRAGMLSSLILLSHRTEFCSHSRSESKFQQL